MSRVMRIDRKIAWVVVFAAMAAGCATPAGRQSREGADTGALITTGQLFSGRYAAVAWSEGQQARALEIAMTPVMREDGALEIEWVQTDQRGGSRSFVLHLQAGALPGRMEGWFEPRGNDARARGRCPVEGQLTSRGPLIRIAPEHCRFGEGAEALALAKEIAHDGTRLSVADRVLDPATGQARVPDQRVEAWPARVFRGWAGRRDVPGTAWRMASGFEIGIVGGITAPMDEAGMPLQIEVDLGLHRLSAKGPTVLRLRVFDQATGGLLAQGWTDPGSETIGVATDSVQVGLRAAGR